MTSATPTPQFPAGVDLIAENRCPIQATNATACILCPFGHLTECHHPKRCDEAQCSHYRRQMEMEA